MRRARVWFVQAMRCPAAFCGLGVFMGVALACAGRTPRNQTPAECMHRCDQDECKYVADGQGDNDAYFECLEACEDKCSR